MDRQIILCVKRNISCGSFTASSVHFNWKLQWFVCISAFFGVSQKCRKRQIFPMRLGWTNKWKAYWSNQASSQQPKHNVFVYLHSPPPFFPHRYGNLHTFPSPMAYPTQDSRKSNFPFQDPLSGTLFSFSSSTGTLWSRSSNGTTCFTSEGELRSTVLWPVFPITGTTVTPQSDNNPPQSSTVLSSCQERGCWLECFWVNTIHKMCFKNKY